MPDNPFWTHYHAAEAAHQAGDFDGAAAAYQAALQYDGVDLFMDYARLYLCLAYRAQGMLAEALAGFEQMARRPLNPRPYPVIQRNLHYYHGCVLFASGDLRAGRAAHRRLLDLLARPETAKDFCLAFHHPADLDFAVRDCTLGGDRFCRALARRAAGDWPAAIADFEAACQAEPRRPALRQWLHAARILQNGFPGSYFPERLLPGVEYVSLEYEEDAAAVHVTRYAAGSPNRAETLPRADGVRLHQQFARSRDWFLLHEQRHHEGSSHTFVKVQ